ncbi:hypothetical protein EV138_3436 [Kribbella voronezhensis]|uniref:DUF4352 domain-containing protein n=1 Tax=Kribbella voronezhensis TaxID=2512212 RepID=A0A4R7TEB4_9ACTN|nr:hypothetical protein [Kribbella voronezhensis]TDU89856.1 hypothetical protein EV138_3436 [Kribbella voronezhensis]
MESLDDVIDAMIADRVIHRHRRKWLIAIAAVLVLALVIFVTGGWKEKKGRKVDTLKAPVTLTAGRYEFGFTSAVIVRTPKTTYEPAASKLVVSFDLKNMDTESQETESLSGGLLRLVPADHSDFIESNGATCRSQLNYKLVYGLPAVPCTTEFKVPNDFADKIAEIGVFGEKWESDNALLGLSDKPYWHNEEPTAVVQLETTIKTEKKDK